MASAPALTASALGDDVFVSRVFRAVDLVDRTNRAPPGVCSRVVIFVSIPE